MVTFLDEGAAWFRRSVGLSLMGGRVDSLSIDGGGGGGGGRWLSGGM